MRVHGCVVEVGGVEGITQMKVVGSVVQVVVVAVMSQTQGSLEYLKMMQCGVRSRHSWCLTRCCCCYDL